MLLVVAYSRDARRSLRNVIRQQEEVTVRHFGRAALLEETGLGAFHALRLREKHDVAIQIERTEPLDATDLVPESVREAARAYAARDEPALPYAKFAAGCDFPDPDRLAAQDLEP